MRLEIADGTTISTPSEADLIRVLSRATSQDDFIILSAGDDYLQCAVTKKGFLAEYQDSSGHYGSKDANLQKDTMEALFLGFLSGDETWKTKVEWKMTTPEKTAPEERKRSFPDELAPPDVVKSMKDHAAREMKRAVSRNTSGLLNRIIRKFTK